MDRVAAAQARLETFKSLAVQARDAAPPCSDCRYGSLLGYCRNPAYSELTFKPETGDYSQRHNTPVGVARSDDGLCGPEGILFECQLPLVAGTRAFIGGLGTSAKYAAAVFFVALWAFLLW